MSPVEMTSETSALFRFTAGFVSFTSMFCVTLANSSFNAGTDISLAASTVMAVQDGKTAARAIHHG